MLRARFCCRQPPPVDRAAGYFRFDPEVASLCCYNDRMLCCPAESAGFLDGKLSSKLPDSGAKSLGNGRLEGARCHWHLQQTWINHLRYLQSAIKSQATRALNKRALPPALLQGVRVLAPVDRDWPEELCATIRSPEAILVARPSPAAGTISPAAALPHR
jgi:hypothetical protein